VNRHFAEASNLPLEGGGQADVEEVMRLLREGTTKATAEPQER
jgi:hypothetical protein